MCISATGPGRAARDPALEVLEAEPSGVAHLTPDPRLRHGEQLADVVPVVVDPLAQQLVDAQETDSWMLSRAGKVRRVEVGGVAQVVASLRGDGRRIPILEVGRDGRDAPARAAGDDRPDAAGEP